MIANPSYKATGCGCGGSGKLSAAPCGCGGADCAACQGQGIARPRFFAGQLLTEDDLQLLTDYVGYKDRLHNRHLFGAGVVCGLEVSCHPCGGGQVIVHPGYALDCCGNDLTLACAEILDINAMVRDLRRDQLGGYDCGDPCPEPEALAAASQDTNSDKKPPSSSAKPKMRYCLYARYCEQKSDPVMPYSTGDDCGSVACEASRIREGVKFELRCQPAGNAASPLIQRLCTCIGDIGRFLKALDSLQKLGSHTVVAQAALATDSAPFTRETIPLLLAANEELVKQVERFSHVGDSGGIPGELVNSVRNAAFYVYRFKALSQTDSLRAGSLPATVEQTQGNIRRAVEVTSTRSVLHFNTIRDWLIERLNNAPFLTDCTLRDKVFAMALPAPSQGRENQAGMIVAVNRPLLEAFINFLRDCVARAMNPACVTCDDPGVLLACLEVGDCQVVKICNLERSFVISPAAVRYWLPPLQFLGNMFERFLCDSLDPLLNGNDPGQLLGDLLNEEIKRILNDSLCVGQGNIIGNLIDKLFPPKKEAPKAVPVIFDDSKNLNETQPQAAEKEPAAEPIGTAAEVITTAAPAAARARAQTGAPKSNGNGKPKNGEKPAAKKKGLPKTRIAKAGAVGTKNSKGGKK